MDFDDEGSQINELRPVTIQTELDRMVEQALVDRTGTPSDDQWLTHTGRILSNPDTLRSYEMDLDKSIPLLHIGPAAPSTSTGSMPRESTPTPPTETYELGPYKIHPRFINQVAIAKLMKNMPLLWNLEDFPNCWALWLENPNVLHTFLLFQLHKNVWKESFKADVTDSINNRYEVPKVACMYYAQSGIPHGTEQNQFQLGLMGFSFVDTSGKGSESSNANRSESAPSSTKRKKGQIKRQKRKNIAARRGTRGASSSLTEQLPDDFIPDARANSSQTKQVPDSDDDDELMGLSYWQKVHKRSIDMLVPIILSDATLSRHCKEQGRSVDRAYLSMLKTVDRLLLANNMIHNSVCGCRDRYDAVLNNLDLELGEYIRPILEKLYPISYIVDYIWGASNDGSTGMTRNVAVPEELFALQLAEMEHMGFMDRGENVIALLSSWGDVEKAVKRLTFIKKKSEEAGEDDSDDSNDSSWEDDSDENAF
ncbi:uncharacterized protein LOC144557102 [Carex rostrata]